MKSSRAENLGAGESAVAHHEETRRPHRSADASTACTVFIRDLSVSTVVGVYEHERTKSLTLLMDLDIELIASAAGETDRIGDTVDYAAVVETVRRELAGKRYFLLERLAEFVVALVLDEFGARRVRLKVAKTGILEGVGQVGVVIERSRPREFGTEDIGRNAAATHPAFVSDET